VKQSLHNQASAHISKLQQIWEDGGFAITVQPPLPLTANAEDFVAQVAAQAVHFDSVLVAEAPGGAVTLSALAAAVLLKRRGIEPIVQVSGRDRNRLALQSDLLGLGALGIANLLVDMRPIMRASLLQNVDARLVTDLDGAALLATAVRMRDEASFISGARIKTPPALYAGALFSFAEHTDLKALSGAQFLVTEPVHDVRAFAAMLAIFQSEQPAFLQARPLLVSLPLLTDTGDGLAGIEQLASSIEALRALDIIRGFNIVMADVNALPLPGQILKGLPGGGVRGGSL
jgi:5,10-methylenetetrahydrofolate reductase